MQHPQGGVGMYTHPPSTGLPPYGSCALGDNAYNDYYAQPAAVAPDQQHTYMAAQQQNLQQLQQQQQLLQQQQHMEAHMQRQQSMHQQLQQQQQHMSAHLQHQYVQQQMEVQLQQQQLQQQQQEEERQQQEAAVSAYASSAFCGGPPSNPMPHSELAKSCRVLSTMGAATGQPQMYEAADDALMRSLQQEDIQTFYNNNSTLSGTQRSVSLGAFDNGLQAQRAEQGGFPQQQVIELQFECVDNMELSHPSALVSLSCFVRPEDEQRKECKIKSVTPYLLPTDLPRGDESAVVHTPQAFVDFKGAKIRLIWHGEEFLHLKINEEVQGQSQSTGFIKLHFSSLQEGIPMRVDVINRHGQPNGFLILRYALLSSPDSAGAGAAYPAAAVAAEHHAAAAAAAELSRLPTMPSNLSLHQQQQQQLRSFRVGEKKLQVPLQQNYGDNTKGMKLAGARQTKHSSNSGMFSRFGRWCCELPNVDLN